MTRRKKDPLRPLTDEEREVLEQISRAQSEPASHVARAKALLAVADNQSYTAAARAAGRRSCDAVSQLVSRFNREGLAAIEPRHGGGPPTVYGVEERKRILAEMQRQPDREKDGAARPVIEEPGLPGLSAPEALRKLFRQRSQARGRQRRAREKLAAMEAELGRRAEQGEERPAPGELSLLSKAELKGLRRRYQPLPGANRACPGPPVGTGSPHHLVRGPCLLDQPRPGVRIGPEPRGDPDPVEAGYPHRPPDVAGGVHRASPQASAVGGSAASGGSPETILHQLLHQGGYFLYHPQERVIISVAYPFQERWMQAAYERYCVILNRKQVRVPIDQDEEWLLLFTWAERGPPPSGDSNDTRIPPKNHL